MSTQTSFFSGSWVMKMGFLISPFGVTACSWHLGFVSDFSSFTSWAWMRVIEREIRVSERCNNFIIVDSLEYEPLINSV